MLPFAVVPWSRQSLLLMMEHLSTLLGLTHRDFFHAAPERLDKPPAN